MHRLLNKLRSKASCLYTGCLTNYVPRLVAYTPFAFLKKVYSIFCVLFTDLQEPIRFQVFWKDNLVFFHKIRFYRILSNSLSRKASYVSSLRLYFIGSRPHMLKLGQLTLETLEKDVKTCSKLKICSASMMLFWFLHCWLWTSKCWLGRYFKMLFKILIFRILTHFIPQVPSYNP